MGNFALPVDTRQAASIMELSRSGSTESTLVEVEGLSNAEVVTTISRKPLYDDLEGYRH